MKVGCWHEIPNTYGNSISFQGGGAEFVFPTDQKKTRTWGERMFSGIGTSYVTGLVIGGSWGFYEGLRNPDGKTMKLRINRLFLTALQLKD